MLNLCRTEAEGSGVSMKVVLPCFSVFQFSAHCSLARECAAVSYADNTVGRLSGVYDCEENGPVASFAAISADSLRGTPGYPVDF